MTGGLNAKVGRLSEDKEKGWDIFRGAILAGSHFSATAANGNDCVYAGSRDWPRYINSILRGSKFPLIITFHKKPA